jgi:hypothetical protein
MNKALDKLLERFVLVKEAESFLQAQLRPGKLYNTSLTLSDIRWGSHWVWKRDISSGWLESVYVSEKSLPINHMRKIDRSDLLVSNFTMEDLYTTLNGSTAEKVPIQFSFIQSVN